jgi:hypothetical protein
MALSGSLNFLTASSYGAGVNGALTLDGDNTDSKASFTAIDFAGLNTIIREPMTASQNYLGQPMDVPMLVDVGVGPTQPVEMTSTFPAITFLYIGCTSNLQASDMQILPFLTR